VLEPVLAPESGVTAKVRDRPNEAGAGKYKERGDHDAEPELVGEPGLSCAPVFCGDLEGERT